MPDPLTTDAAADAAAAQAGDEAAFSRLIARHALRATLADLLA